MAKPRPGLLEAILDLSNQGLHRVEVAQRLGCHPQTVTRNLQRAGVLLSKTRERGMPPPRVDEQHSLCAKCGSIVPNEEFPWLRSAEDGRRLSYCRKCRYRQARENLTPQSYWADKLSRVRRNQRGYACDLPDGYLWELWQKQDGRCFYTDARMEIQLGRGKSHSAASVDRVDNSIGYLVGNVVLCTTKVNLIKRDVTLDEMKDWMPGWYQRVLALRK